MQPGLPAAERPETAPEDRLEERKEMDVPGPVDEPGPGDDGGEALRPAAPDLPFGAGLRLLVDVCRPERRFLVGRAIAGHPENPCCAAIDEAFEARCPRAAVEYEPGAQHVRLPVFGRGDAGDQQRSGEVEDDLHAVHRGPDRGPVGYVAQGDFGTQGRQRLRPGPRPREHAHPRAAEEETPGQAAPQEAGPARDERRRAGGPRGPGPRGMPGHGGGSRRPARRVADAARERATSTATFRSVGPWVSMFV